jgi:hypothetical protein
MSGAQCTRRPSTPHSTVAQTGEYLHLGLAEGRPLPLRGLRPALWQDLPWRGGNPPSLQACRRAQHPCGQRNLVRRADLQAGQARDVEPLEAEHPGRLDQRPAQQHRMRNADENRLRHSRGRPRRRRCAFAAPGLWFFPGRPMGRRQAGHPYRKSSGLLGTYRRMAIQAVSASTTVRARIMPSSGWLRSSTRSSRLAAAWAGDWHVMHLGGERKRAPAWKAR